MAQAKQQISTPLLLCLALITATPALATDMYLPALPEIAQALNTTTPMVQLTLSAFMVGMAVGQLIIGPISDSLGRKKLLIAGALASLLASVACALAPHIGILIAMRLVQGLGGGACVVIARAIVPDLARGKAAAQAFALLMVIQGAAPILAPVIGGFISAPLGWRAVFWALALINAMQLLVAVFFIRESRPPEERTGAGLRGLIHNYLFVLRDPKFIAYTLVLGFTFGTVFSYISASPFVLQNQMGLSPMLFSVVFAVNAFGMMLCGMLNRRLLNRFHPHQIMQVALVNFIVLSLVLLLTVIFTDSPWLFLVLLFMIIAHSPMIMANSTALGTAVVRSHAGSGAAIMGFAQFSMGGVVSPLVGLGPDRAFTMAVVMSVCGVIACAAAWRAGRGGMVSMS